MRVYVDADKCEGFGTCNAVLPEVFHLDEWGYAYVVSDGDGRVSTDHKSSAHEAEALCPAQAITVDDE
jgi:ferredoxin